MFHVVIKGRRTGISKINDIEHDTLSRNFGK